MSKPRCFTASTVPEAVAVGTSKKRPGEQERAWQAEYMDCGSDNRDTSDRSRFPRDIPKSFRSLDVSGGGSEMKIILFLLNKFLFVS